MAARSLAMVRAVLQPGISFVEVVAAIGEPEADIGSGLHVWRFDLDDGTSVLVGTPGDAVMYARHVAPATDAGHAGPFRILERLLGR